jgi:hypothetical protein
MARGRSLDAPAAAASARTFVTAPAIFGASNRGEMEHGADHKIAPRLNHQGMMQFASVW